MVSILFIALGGGASGDELMARKLDPKQRTVAVLVGVVMTMGALGFASQAGAASDTVLDRTINVRFDGSLKSQMTIRIGETGLAFYEAYNPTDRPIAGQASYNVFPFTAGGYFNKIDCFCFTEQVLQPGERVQMPVTFFVDPEIVDDPDGKFVEEITLSYTFYEIDLPEVNAQASLIPEQPATETEYN
ncbi:Cytochrome c oxidase assembly protein CtaG [Nymphon striatum]|nr:Cytochrome c oxidase assembly protein CtaG [Nymphon striatum]